MDKRRKSLWDQGKDEPVGINQRALIDKILARYSGEFSVFRELLQNADDASATTAELRFDTRENITESVKTAHVTEESLSLSSEGMKPSDQLGFPHLKPVYRWTFRNNGKPFRHEDWTRLKKIAEGNPDEQAIGAFGIGFYSLFSVTDEPFVQSGTKWMGFYWRPADEQLIARQGSVTQSARDHKWTTFEIPLREPAPLPGLPLDIAQFLATSLTFMANLRSVSMFLDGKNIARIEKEIGIPRKLGIPAGFKMTSPSGMLNATRATSTSVYMKATVSRWLYGTGKRTSTTIPTETKRCVKTTSASLVSSFFSPFVSSRPSTPVKSALTGELTEGPWQVVESATQKSIFAVEFAVRLDGRLNAELERATKKSPPRTALYQLIYTSRDEYDANKKEDKQDPEGVKSIFHGLRADLDRSGHAHIFIGHATSQNTGIGSHTSAPFIPTVERESIDFVNRNVSLWNKELLYMGGLLARVVYELELTGISEHWADTIGNSLASRSNISNTDNLLQAWFQDRCLYALHFFTVYPTKPSSVVGEQFQEAFFGCKTPEYYSLPLISTLGVKPARDVRAYNEEIAGMLRKTPMIPPQVVKENPLMLRALRERGMCLDVRPEDILNEVTDRILNEQEIVTLLQWLARMDPQQLITDERDFKESILHETRFYVEQEGTSGDPVHLGSIETFIEPHHMTVSTESSLPTHTLPPRVHQSLGDMDLERLFGWLELTVFDWVIHLVSSNSQAAMDVNITRNPVFAENVLGVIAGAWPSMSQTRQSFICTLLSSVPCIPTTDGIKIPKMAYFPNTHQFPFLAVMDLPSGAVVKGALRKFLIALGVKPHVEIKIIFSQMIQTGIWKTANLINYLVDIRDTLSSLEIATLKQMKLFTREEGESFSEPQFYLASELYEPVNTFRELGLPLLSWYPSNRWKAGAAARFMFELGLKRFPSLETILNRIGTTKLNYRAAAVKYFMDNYDTRYKHYRPSDFNHINCIPAVKLDGTTCLGRPNNVFSNAQCAIMGFSVVDPSLDERFVCKLQVPSNPPAELLLATLADDPPRDHELARKTYEYLTSRIADFTVPQLARIAMTAFIPGPGNPASKNDDLHIQHMFRPSEVYFGDLQSWGDPRSSLFVYVDFGADAAKFLKMVGVSDQPNIWQVCRVIMNNPQLYKDMIGGYEQYSSELKQIGTRAEFLQPEMLRKMRQSRMFVGKRKAPTLFTKATDKNGRMDANDLETDIEVHLELLLPEEIVIVDDMHSYGLFGHEIWSAPQDKDIEILYEAAGSQRLSTLVSKEYKIIPSQSHDNSHKVMDIRLLVLERLPIFLNEHNDAQHDVTPEWLSRGRNFQVVPASGIQLTRRFKDDRIPPGTQELSAAVQREGQQGTVTLWINENLEVDYYEIAESLCSVVFTSHKINDSMVFTTILSTDLRALKRRGLVVNGASRQDKVKRNSANMAWRRLEDERKESGATKTYAVRGLDQANEESAITSATEGSQNVWIFPISPAGEYAGERPEKHWWLFNTQQPLITASNLEPGVSQGYTGDEFKSRYEWSPEGWSLLHSPRQMTIVRGPLEQGYCRFDESIESFFFRGLAASYRVYTTQDILDYDRFLGQKYDALTRFANHIVTPLRTIYELSPSSVHIVHSSKVGLISLSHNETCSLFLNFKCYEDWHDKFVKRGDLAKALTFWYFALARELADNLALPHFSHPEHEYFVRSLVEYHMSDFLALLSCSKSQAA